MTRVLLLGGTSEAGQMAAALAEAGVDAVYSYAGRTAQPVAQPLPQRVGGFGGVAGLITYLQDDGITHVIDATHPFAETMSAHAVAACAAVRIPLAGFERPAWEPVPGDRWTHLRSMAEAVAALPDTPARIFLAIGRQHLEDFAAKPQHHYLLRLVDAPEAMPLPHAEAVISRGPFTLEGDLTLLRDHEIQIIIAKNSGGNGARAKLDAARALGLPVILIDRPALAERPSFATATEVMHWLHSTLRGV